VPKVLSGGLRLGKGDISESFGIPGSPMGGLVPGGMMGSILGAEGEDGPESGGTQYYSPRHRVPSVGERKAALLRVLDLFQQGGIEFV
jgi:hypothetical protein